MNKLINYSGSEKKKIERELAGIFKNAEPGLSFWQILDEVFANNTINMLIQGKNVDSINQKLSAGTSVKKAPKVLLDILTRSIRQDNYRFYTPSAGSIRSRASIATRESISANLRMALSAEDVVITTGSTGAISSVFEYVKNEYPKGEVVISSPTYYLYPFCANYYRLPLKEVSNTKSLAGGGNTFLSPNEIIRAINKKTKLVCIVNPTNPSGEYYTTQDLEKILRKAKRCGCIVLVDELFGFLDYEGIRNRYPALKASENVKAENNLVIVNGYSKALNLAGIRIGYLLTRNETLRKGIVRINEVRNCFPVGYQYDELIEVDSLLRIINLIDKEKKNIESSISRAIQITGTSIPKQKVEEYYQNYWTLILSTVNDYKEQYYYSIDFLSRFAEKIIKPDSGFNSIIKLKLGKNINQLDFAINCFLATGVKIQIGPCFGLKQKDWEEKYGVWLRLTTARETSVYKLALESLQTFINSYSKGWRVVKVDFRVD